MQVITGIFHLYSGPRTSFAPAPRPLPLLLGWNCDGGHAGTKVSRAAKSPSPSMAEPPEPAPILGAIRETDSLLLCPDHCLSGRLVTQV